MYSLYKLIVQNEFIGMKNAEVSMEYNVCHVCNENNGMLMNTNLEVLAQVVDGDVAFVVVVERSEAIGKLVVFVARE